MILRYYAYITFKLYALSDSRIDHLTFSLFSNMTLQQLLEVTDSQLDEIHIFTNPHSFDF